MYVNPFCFSVLLQRLARNFNNVIKKQSIIKSE